MGKSKDQREAEAMDLQRQRDQMDANKWMAEFSKELAAMSKERFQKEQAFLEENVDPSLKGYIKSGFAPGEEKRLRAQDEERTARIHSQGERTVLGNMARGGFKGTGAEARARMGLGAARAESRVAGQRAISQYGADSRRTAVGQGMVRSSLASGSATLAGVAGGRPVNIAQAKFGPGFWGKFGGAALKLGQSFVGSMNPLGGFGGGGGGMTAGLDQGTGGYYSYNAMRKLPVSQPA